MISQSHQLLLLPHLQGILADPSQKLVPPPQIFKFSFCYMQKERREKAAWPVLKILYLLPWMMGLIWPDEMSVRERPTSKLVP